MRRIQRRLLVVLVGIGLLAALPVAPAFAFHGGPDSDIRVGRNVTNTGNENRFHKGDITLYVGQSATLTFAAGAHNAGIDGGSLPGGAAPFGSPQFAGGSGEPTSSTWSYTFGTAGTYRYYCSVHASQDDANSATYSGGEVTSNKMVGRITVLTDTTAPTWGAAAPTATAASSSQIDLTWPAAADPETGVSLYRVYEATGETLPAKPGAPVTTTTATSLSRTGLTSGSHYWYWVTAVNGAGTASATDQQSDATTSSVAASAAASGVVVFAVDPTLSITVSPAMLDLGAVSPAAPATGSESVTVKSNAAWSLKVKSIGRNAVDDGPGGDDQVFTSGGGSPSTIPVSRLTWKVGAGGPLPMSDVDATVLTAQPATTSSGTVTPVDLALLVEYTDPPATDYQTVLVYTASQP